jgi:hypothetical protein
MRHSLSRWTLVLAGGLALGFWLYTSRGGDRADGPAKRVPRGSEVADLWPVARSWAWEVDPVATKGKVGVCVRTVESKIPPGTSPGLPSPPVLPAKGDERHSGWTLIGDQRVAGRVTCQVIDFREAGLGEVVGKKPLRLLVRLRITNGVSSIGGPSAVLEGETIEGTKEVEPRWAGDELHLLTVYTRAGDTLYAHHVFVQQRAGD